MTGWFHHLTGPGAPSHLRAEFGLDDGSRLLYCDQRRFGTMRLIEPGELEELWRGRIGPEPLEGWSAPDLRRALRGRTAPIKALLLDQRIVAGVGNIYADEALWEARIHPRAGRGDRPGPGGAAARRRDRGARARHRLQGASIDTYRQRGRGAGSMQERFVVYDRTGEPCLRCGTPIAKTVVAQRGTHYCPRCTPRP